MSRRFVSTRRPAGSTRTYSYCEMLQTGYCDDGGILLPEVLPKVDSLRAWSRLPFSGLALEIMKLFCPDDNEEGIPHETLAALLADAHSPPTFGSADVVPVVPFEEGINVAELFHGCTHAFKVS
jgi:threonine synthase